MNFQEIVDNSRLVYTFKSKWALKKIVCKVRFYEAYPIEDIDKIICEIVGSHVVIHEDVLATILGFNVIDDFTTEPKRYADNAEKELFNTILKPVLKWNLIKREKGLLSLTEFGNEALKSGLKYKFFYGEKFLFENLNLFPKELDKNKFFPYYEALGIFSDITAKSKIPTENIDLPSILNAEESELTKRHRLQSQSTLNIFKSESTPIFVIKSKEVEIHLFENEEKYFPIIYHNGLISMAANELLYLPENEKLYNQKIEEGLYKKLINDESVVLCFENLFPFEDLLEFDSLIYDKRINWVDVKLLEYLWSATNANHWRRLTEKSNLEYLKENLSQLEEKVNWSALSYRIDDIFLLKHATDFPWDFSSISRDENRSVSTIQELLLNDEVAEKDWDWLVITEKLSFDFITRNISRLDFDLTGITTEESDSVKELIVKYPDKNWDYSYISNKYDLAFLLGNISEIGEHVKLETIIKRGFTDNYWYKQFCYFEEFKSSLQSAKENQLSDFVITNQEFIWDIHSIDFFNNINLINWESGRYSFGFECNPHVSWDNEIFSKYHHLIKTEKGYSHISRSISDVSLIVTYPSFNWDWAALSGNKLIINTDGFLHNYLDKVDWSILIQNIDFPIIEHEFEELSLIEVLQDSAELWPDFTKRCSIEFIREHIHYGWDWTIITQRFYKHIKIGSLGNDKWVNKWDWNFLTQNLELGQIKEYLDEYKEYWNWKHLTKSLDIQTIKENLEYYNEFWDWIQLIESRFSKEDIKLDSKLKVIATCLSVKENNLRKVLWKSLTERFTFQELKQLVVDTENFRIFEWDKEYFINHPEFNVRKYLDDYIDFIDWDILSSSKNLNKDLRWDKQLWHRNGWYNDVASRLERAEYKWNFERLSHLDSINWNERILSKFKDKWDWDYLSEYSSCFKANEYLLATLKKFSNLINFQLFSRRTDSEISENVISEFINKNWDWSVLSNNPSLSISCQFLYKYSDKSWDWKAISGNSNLKLDNEFLLALKDKDWDWDIISNRTDIVFTDEFIKSLFEKPLNWLVISSKEEFLPTIETLSLLIDKNLDWNVISGKIIVTSKPDSLIKFKHLLNWKKVTSNLTLDLSNQNILNAYSEYLDWDFISASENFNLSFQNLKQYQSKLNWNIINRRGDFEIKTEFLEEFFDVLDWTVVSDSMHLDFNKGLIERFKDKWDWLTLANNPRIIEQQSDLLDSYLPELNTVRFLEKFEHLYGEPYIYHFTHLFNAIEVIKGRKILSRNKAMGSFANAAGDLVNRRHDAHEYARFYFRPQTPTQFYNECLGWDSKSGYYKEWYYDGEEHRKWIDYYPQAKNLGLPKCPIPVFFKFSLKEVLNKMKQICFYSSGNMQSNGARIYKVCESPDNLNVNYLYSTIKDGLDIYRQYSQQEFLVHNHFDFSELSSFEIICYDDQYKNLLLQLIGDDEIKTKICSNGYSIFHRSNRSIKLDESDNNISISTDYQDDAYFKLECNNLRDLNISNPEAIKKETSTEIYAYPKLVFEKTTHPIQVYFVDKSIGIRDWLIYDNSGINKKDVIHVLPEKLIDSICEIKPNLKQLYDAKVRHYTIKKHTTLVISEFDKHFSSINMKFDKASFRVFLALHDIGKPNAERDGCRKEQHKYTIQILAEIWDELRTSMPLQVATALAKEDLLGLYFQKRISAKDVATGIKGLSDYCNMNAQDFFSLYMCYYQSDIAAYTEDAGGLRFLEHMFSYNQKGEKIFNKEEGMLQFSDMNQTLYHNLKEEIWKLN